MVWDEARAGSMGNVVKLRSSPIDLTSDEEDHFVTDCTRAAEGLITDDEIREKYELSLPIGAPSPKT